MIYRLLISNTETNNLVSESLLDLSRSSDVVLESWSMLGGYYCIKKCSQGLIRFCLLIDFYCQKRETFLQPLH